MLKKFLIILNVLIMILLATACDSNLLNFEKEIKLQLAFPDIVADSYKVKIYAERDGGGVTDFYEYENISSSEIFNKSLSINEKADFMMIYLFRDYEYYGYNLDPCYYYRCNLHKRDLFEVKTDDWIEYDDFY